MSDMLLVTQEELFEKISAYNASITASSIGSLTEGMPVKLIGEVVDVDDDMLQCRIRCQIDGFTRFANNEITTDKLPWCYADSSMMNMYDAPIVGDWVMLDLSRGVYNMTWMHLDSRSDIAKDVIGDENAKAKIVVYDDAERYGTEGKFGIWWTPEQGWHIHYNGTDINLRKDKSIHMTTDADKNGVIHMTADGHLSFGSTDKSEQPCVVGDDNKTAHQNVLDYVKEVVDNLAKVMKRLQTTAQGNPYTSPLAPVFGSYPTNVQQPSNNTHKKDSDFLPETLSKIATIDKGQD